MLERPSSLKLGPTKWLVELRLGLNLDSTIALYFLYLQQTVPVYEHMFSDLRQYPRFSYRLQSRDPVPTHVSRQWLGQAEAHREQIALSRL